MLLVVCIHSDENYISFFCPFVGNHRRFVCFRTISIIGRAEGEQHSTVVIKLFLLDTCTPSSIPGVSKKNFKGEIRFAVVVV